MPNDIVQLALPMNIVHLTKQAQSTVDIVAKKTLALRLETPGRREQISNSVSNDESEPKSSATRLLSLDVFRGLTILGMLLVNNMALDTATPRQFTHAAWNQGVHFADLVFPWFLLIVGVAIPYAFASHIRKGASTRNFLLKAIRRTVSLILLGCFVDSSVARHLSIGMGVLQLIGLAYFTAVLIYQLPTRLRAITAFALLTAHWAVIRFVPMPGSSAGVFLESKNIIQYLNQTYLQHYHLNGIISVVPTTALVLIGTAAGDLLRAATVIPSRKVAYLCVGGLILSFVGWLWNLDLSFNKSVWTASYILYAAGFGSAILGLLYMLIDVKGHQRWAFPLAILGANAIMAYILPIAVKVYVLQGWSWSMPDGSSLSMQQAVLQLLTGYTGRVCGGWLYTIGYIVFWWLIFYQFYRKKIFLRV
jgi:predicted acyltransferase